MALIAVRNLSMLFGPAPRRALELVRAGMGKEALLARSHNVLALDDVSLDVEAGETFVVMGLSGSGKSTLIRNMNRLVDPTAGRIVIGGTDVLGLTIGALEQFRRRTMAMVFQHFGLFPHRTVIDNAAYGLEVRGVPRAERRARAAEWVATVGLGGYEGRYPAALSGGMQQRVGLARALCADTPILLMDEAFSALDPLIRSEMQEQLADLQRRLRKTIVFITHDLDEALRLGDRVAILKDGRICQVGTPAEIVEQPADDYVRAFVAAVNRPRPGRP